MTLLRFPHETEPVLTQMIGWPSGHLWTDHLMPARETTIALARAAFEGAGRQPRVLVSADASASVNEALAAVAEPKVLSVGDIWLRDTAPVFLQSDDGLKAAGFHFNGWGGRFPNRDDSALAALLAREFDAPFHRLEMIGEGGAIETDGEGTLLTTRDVLLNANRNPSLDEKDVNAILTKGLGIDKVLWCDDGLLFDHTDGHIDNVARFVRPGLVVCQAPSGRDDPQAARLDHVALAFDNARDAHGRPIEVARIPSPGVVLDDKRAPMPASHMNYIFSGKRIIVPTYEERYSEEAIKALAGLFPEYEVIGLPGIEILKEGGAFHCMSNTVPVRKKP
jgi:agmatine deiminase